MLSRLFMREVYVESTRQRRRERCGRESLGSRRFPPFPRRIICDMSKRGWEKKGGDTKEKGRNEIRKAEEKSWKKALEYIFNWTAYTTKPRAGACLGDEFEKEREVTERTRAFRCTHRVGPSP